MKVQMGDAYVAHGLDVAAIIKAWADMTANEATDNLDSIGAAIEDIKGQMAYGIIVESTSYVGTARANGQLFFVHANPEGISVYVASRDYGTDELQDLYYVGADALPLVVSFDCDVEGEEGNARAALLVEVARRDASGDRTKVVQTAAEFLSTRESVDSVCAALGVSLSDFIVEETEGQNDLSGWTYVDGWGSLVYMVQYQNGKVGAVFGNQEVLADNLADAEKQLVNIFRFEEN